MFLLKRSKSRSEIFQNDYNQYGHKSFVFGDITKVGFSDKIARVPDSMEMYYIKKYEAKYNVMFIKRLYENAIKNIIPKNIQLA